MRPHMPGPGRRDRLDQGGLAAPVLADEHGQARCGLEAVVDELAHSWNRERPAFGADLSSVDLDATQRRPRQRGHRPNLLRRVPAVTRLLSPPAAVEVTLADDGTPAFISGAFSGSLAPIARWKVETEWWKQPVVREYWKALLNSNLLCELYHDLSRDEWFVERVYD